MEMLLSGVNSLLAIGVVLGLCLFFHEAGHFLAAKACRMGVYEFALGFGPALYKRKMRDTVYSIRSLPLGGFVRIAGMDGEDRDAPNSFYSRPWWQGLFVIVAGVLMNIVLAVLVYWTVYVFSGIPAPDSTEVIIRKVFAGDPAETGGMKVGDNIIGVGGSYRCTEIVAVDEGSLAEKMGLKAGHRVFQIGDEQVSIPGDILEQLRAAGDKPPKVWVMNGEGESIEERVFSVDPPPPSALADVPAELSGEEGDRLAKQILGARFAPLDQETAHTYISTRPDERLTLTVLRDGETVHLAVTPESKYARVGMVDDGGKLHSPHRLVGRIGITLGPRLERVGVFEGLKLGVVQSYGAVAMVILSLKAMIVGQIAAEPTGPIGIMAMTAETAKLGWAAVLTWCGFISANLAVINMLPIPPFDGGQSVLIIIEAALRRRINEALEMAVRLAGLALILVLFAWLAYGDILNLVKFRTY